MARFYGKVQGQRGEATRLGGGKSGLQTTAASYSGAVKVDLFDRDGIDYCEVSLIPWMGHGTNRLLYRGPLSGQPVNPPTLATHGVYHESANGNGN
jgi:hypothetical protein